MRKWRPTLSFVLLFLAGLLGEASATPLLVSDNAGILYSVDSVTGAATTIGPMHYPAGTTGVAMYDIAMDSAGHLFGVSYAASGQVLYSIDPTTGEILDLLGPTGTDLLGLAFDASGTLYGTSALDGAGLYTVDTTTGAGSFVGPVNEGAVGYNFIQDIAFDSSGVMYGIGDTGDGHSHLITIDPLSGAGTQIGVSNFSPPSYGLGLAFDADDNLFVAWRPGVLFSMDTSTAHVTYVADGPYALGATSNPFGSGPGPEPVPEPSTFGLLMMGLGFVVRRMSRHSR